VRHIFSVIAVMLTASCFWELNACVSAGFAAQQPVRLRAVDDQKAVTMIRKHAARAALFGVLCVCESSLCLV
jgi:hypothetical protein